MLLCDDQELVRAGFRLILGLEGDIDVVGEAGDGQECLRLTAEHRPDVVLMDVRMPRMDGIEATRRLVGAGSTSRVLMLTTFDLDELVYAAMAAGASGFLLKDVPREQLVAAVRMVARGDAVLAPALTRRLVERFVAAPPPGAGVPAALAPLSERELDVFALRARGRSNAQIAAELFLGEATVKTHVARILTKLDLRDRVHAVVLAYETGYLRPGQQDGSPG
ncbi:MAG TPA: response regulator transcription factor [Motilibacteraceae bacterium]|nr:response regulator transcription factor [Motilibacteraceae bacterium]